MSVETLLSSKLTVRSKKLIFLIWLKGEVYIGMLFVKILEKKLMFFFTVCPNKNISLIYRYRTNGRYSCVLRKSVSNLSMKIQVYVGVNLVPIAVPNMCCFTIPLNSKSLFSNTKRTFLIRSLVLIYRYNFSAV